MQWLLIMYHLSKTYANISNENKDYFLNQILFYPNESYTKAFMMQSIQVIWYQSTTGHLSTKIV